MSPSEVLRQMPPCPEPRLPRRIENAPPGEGDDGTVLTSSEWGDWFDAVYTRLNEAGFTIVGKDTLQRLCDTVKALSAQTLMCDECSRRQLASRAKRGKARGSGGSDV